MIVREVAKPDPTPQPRVPRKANTLGARLTERRLQLGLTQRAVAEQAGISPLRLGHLERDDYGNLCTAYTLAHLARALGTSMEWLWWGDGCARTSGGGE